MRHGPSLAGIQLVVLLCCLAVALPPAARAQTAFLSATGTFTATGGAFQNVNFTLSQAGNYTMRTWAYGGGVNAAGQTVAPGGIDALLTLSQLPGGAVVAQHDNISGTDRDALIHQPTLPIGFYALRTERAAPGGTDAWATDVVNGSGSLTVTALPASSSHVDSVALGATGAARSTLLLNVATPFNIPGSLDVRSGGVVQVNAGSHAVSGTTTVRAGAGLIVNDGNFISTGTIAVDGGRIEDNGPLASFIDGPLRITNSGVAVLNSGTSRDVVMDNGGSLSALQMVIAPQYVADIGGATTRFSLQGSNFVALSAGGPVSIHSGAAGSMTGGRMSVGNVLRVSDATLTLVDSSVSIATNSINGTIIVEGSGARFTHTGTGSIQIAVYDGPPTEPPGSGAIVVDDGAVFDAHGPVIVGSRGLLEVRDGGKFVVRQSLGFESAFGPGPVVLIGGGSGAWNGQLDLTTAGAPLRTFTAQEQDLRIDQLRSGHNAGAWDGPGIMSSAAAVNEGFALGYAALSVDLFRIAYTRYGDADLNRVVDLNDFNALAANFGQTNRRWEHGDFNYDFVVNLADFNLLAANFGMSAGGAAVTPVDWAALASAIPEPAGSVALLGCAGRLMMRRRAARSR